jgi:hypothetical protein
MLWPTAGSQGWYCGPQRGARAGTVAHSVEPGRCCDPLQETVAGGVDQPGTVVGAVAHSGEQGLVM